MQVVVLRTRKYFCLVHWLKKESIIKVQFNIKESSTEDVDEDHLPGPLRKRTQRLSRG